MVGLSGGVDSAVAAYLLQKQGYDVHAVFMKNFGGRGNVSLDGCTWADDWRAAQGVAEALRLPLQIWDFRSEYRQRVLNCMFQEYQAGRTPNPDIICNKEIKFKAFLDRARRQGYNMIATGHYARTRVTGYPATCIDSNEGGITPERDGLRVTRHLLKGKDPDKDQSYFLARLDQAQLAHALFPLGNYTKKQVRALARKINLPNADRPDSQGICFVGEVPMKDFLKTVIKPKKGDIVTTNGRKIGKHEGIFFYTIGQRKGIGVGGGPAFYVIDKNVKKNLLIVGSEDNLKLFSSELTASQVHWIAKKPQLPLRAKAKIRYRQEDQTVTIYRKAHNKIRARFEKPQRAISPGQTLVIYRGQELVACGTID